MDPAKNGNSYDSPLPPDAMELLNDPRLEGLTDGQALDGYSFLDVIRLHYAYDYKRSVVHVEAKNGRRFPRLGHDRAMREDIPSDAQLFRDSFYRHHVLVSRELASRIARLASRELSFSDVHTHRLVEFPPARAKQTLKACLKQGQMPQDDESMPLQRRIRIRVIPLLHDGRLAEAESLLTDWLRARPVTPYHVVADLQITTSPQACAEYFDEFCVRAQQEAQVKTIYSEMNGFTINPDLWFCDAFAIAFEGNEDGDDWLADFHSSTDEKLIITGLEPLQEVFANQMQSGPVEVAQHEARDLAAALVIVKFQRLLQSSLPFMKVMKCPLWATAHDHYEFLANLKAK